MSGLRRRFLQMQDQENCQFLLFSLVISLAVWEYLHFLIYISHAYLVLLFEDFIKLRTISMAFSIIGCLLAIMIALAFLDSGLGKRKWIGAAISILIAIIYLVHLPLTP